MKEASPDFGIDYEDANQSKANFDDIYNAPDPRAYYRTLGGLDYQIPSEAKPVFRAVMELLGREKLKIVDIGCSYGVNAAMLTYDLEFADLVERYSQPTLESASTAEVIVQDARDFDGMTALPGSSFVGIDIAGEAAGYARAVGLIDEAIVENLEEDRLSPSAQSALKGADMIITTGAIGYVSEQTISQVVAAAGEDPPWVAAFALRQFPFGSIAEALEGYGLLTERLENRYFVQRAFRDREEAEGAFDAVAAAGRDPQGVESRLGYVAEFHLCAPRTPGGMLRHLRL